MIPSYITTVFLSILFIACHSGSQPVSARTRTVPPGKFNEDPIKAVASPMVYDTTSPQSREMIAKLDEY